ARLALGREQGLLQDTFVGVLAALQDDGALCVDYPPALFHELVGLVVLLGQSGVAVLDDNGLAVLAEEGALDLVAALVVLYRVPLVSIRVQGGPVVGIEIADLCQLAALVVL